MREAKAEYKNLAIMWAGGKDSTLMLYIAREAYYNQLPKVIFLDTTFDFRETKEFIRRVKAFWKIDLLYAQNREVLSKGINPWDYSKMECCTKLKTDALNQAIEKHKFDGLMFAIRWDEHPIRGKELYFSPRDVPEHMRVHPMLHWSEDDIWAFIKKYNVPYNPLYDREINGKKYRSLGCYPCTSPLSDEEWKKMGERAGRSQDKEKIMERLRALGYM
jgi:3'-phosphoadenosine 5'-phosphosulfate sulfotransferase (PAPS reductase)/FAD synthetase